MLKPFCHEQTVVIDGETLRLVLDFRAIDATEQLLGKGYDAILDQILTLQMGENGLTMGLALQKLLEAAFPTADKVKAENPPRRRGASRPS
jgi:hypothetical protein